MVVAYNLVQLENRGRQDGVKIQESKDLKDVGKPDLVQFQNVIPAYPLRGGAGEMKYSSPIQGGYGKKLKSSSCNNREDTKERRQALKAYFM